MCGRGKLAPYVSFPQRYSPSRSITVSASGSYTVKKGDTLYSIAQAHGIPLNDLIQTNHIKEPFVLSLGQTLTLPKAKLHIVKKGETLYSIARLYGMDQYTLTHLNNLTYPYILSIGQALRISEAQLSKSQRKSRPQKKKRIKNAWSLPSREGRFTRPISGRVISRYGGKKDGAFNDGINIAAPLGTPVKSAESGLVVYTGKSIKSFGNLVLIKHQGGWVTAYGHLKNISVKEGEKIKRGHAIGHVGKTGFVKSPQLHFELRKGSKTYDPKKYVSL